MSLLRLFQKAAAQSRSTSDGATSIIEEDGMDHDSPTRLEDYHPDLTCQSPSK